MAIKEEKRIYDNVHGYIGLSRAELRILDSPVFQRLRGIKQLGPADLVYPGATHTRFLHSVGTLYMMDQFLRNAVREKVDDEYAQKMRLAALMHDLGHYPYSHTTEHIAVKRLGSMDHIRAGSLLIKRFMEERLENYTVNEITGIIKGRGDSVSSLLMSSALDADKSDYMLRDSYNTGVPYGRIDVSTMLRILSFEKGRIIFEKDESPVENFLIDRYHLYRTVIHHKTVVAFNLLLQRIFELLVENGHIQQPDWVFSKGSEDEVAGYTDAYLLSAMRGLAAIKRHGFLNEITRMFLNRIPLELAYAAEEPVAGSGALPACKAVKRLEESDSFRKELADRSGIPAEWLFPVTLRDLGLIDENTHIYIRRKKEKRLVPLSMSKALVLRMIGSRTLSDSRIYTKKGHGGRVRKAFEEMI